MLMIVWWVVRNKSVRDAEAVFVDDIANLTGKFVKGAHCADLAAWIG